MYQLRSPAAVLAPYIESYWFVAPDPGPVDLSVNVFVDGRADLILNYGVPYKRHIIGGISTEHGRSNLDVQRLVPIRIEQRGLVHVVGVRFHLGGLGPFVRSELRAHTGQTVAPSDLLGEGMVGLEEQLRGLEPDAAVPLLDHFFCRRLRLDSGRSGFERALDALQSRGGQLEVQQVAARAGASVRQVDRWFARHIGIAPKMVGRIIRFQGVLRMLMRDPGCTLAEVAAAAGYFDQAHFVRDFRQMSGGVPRGYRGYFPPAGPADFSPNVVVFVQEEAGPGE